MKGIVVSPVEIIGKNSISVNGTIEPEKLRKYLLYWDKIDFPQSNIIGFGNSPDLEFLENAGVLKRSRFHVRGGGEVADLHLKVQLTALRKNNDTERGCWSLAQEGINFVIPTRETVLDRCIELSLYNSLPIPSIESSFEDILTFKERRNDELLEFRLLLDGIFQEILKAGDSERAIETHLHKIDRQVDAISRTMNESIGKVLWSNLKVRFDVGDLIRNTTIGAFGASQLGVSVTTGAALGLASSIKLNTEMLLKPKGIPTELKDFAYLFYANQELK
ncbi:DUF6236 family protein [Bacillus sp. 2205SS5-2]|uniref:DUF6236 family protein n=1 Tax=Bacillus sp. 2205SS5-2 TaxID=3109031 RepID=UPI003006F3D8